MFSKTFLIAALVGGLTYVFKKAKQEVILDRQLDNKAKLRWEDEGGPPVPRAV